MKADSKVTLFLGNIQKVRANIRHHRFPVFSSFGMRLQLYGNNDYVFNGIVEISQCIGKSLVPLFLFGQLQLGDSCHMKPVNM